MASSLSSAFASPFVNSKSSPNLPHCSNSARSTVSFRPSPFPHLRFSSKDQQPLCNSSTLVRAQSNEESFFQRFSLEDLFSNLESFVESIFGSSDASKVAVDGPSNASPSSSIQQEAPSEETKDTKQTEKPSTPALATEESVSQFMTQVSSLVKLVDSRDIVELHLKQYDFELVIKKKEALPQPVFPAPVAMAHPPSPLPQLAPPPGPPSASSAPPSAPSQSPAPPAAKPQKSSLPPLKCPMAGTFYRSPAPGEPPFVKVGDKVQKGQVICIIEAMKLMNEIEADQSGTIVEIIAEDGKPVSVDTPLFVIEP